MSMRDIMNGNISSSSDLRDAIQYFSESDKKDSLSSVILESWKRLGHPYICINESSAFYNYAPNEMKPIRMTPLLESAEIGEQEIPIIGTFRDMLIQFTSQNRLPKLMSDIVEEELTTDKILTILNKYENKYNNGDMDIDEFKIHKSILDICNKLVENHIWFNDDSVMGNMCKEYISEFILKESNMLVYNQFTSANTSIDYYSKLSNGGLYYKLEKHLNSGYKPRVSDLQESYDPSLNNYYKYTIDDSSHMLFCLKLLQWVSPNTPSDIVRDEAMITNWNERVNEYYGKLNSSDDETDRAKYMQMLDDIMWDYNCDPSDKIVRKSNLDAKLKRILVTPISLYVMCNGSLFYDDLLKMSQMSLTYNHSYGSRLVNISNHDDSIDNDTKGRVVGSSASDGAVDVITDSSDIESMNESVTLTPVQQMLSRVMTVEDYRNINQLLDNSEPTIDACDLMYLDSLLELNYQYAPLKSETSEMLSLKEKVLCNLAKLYTDDLLVRFRKSIYFEMYCNNKNMLKQSKLNG